MSATEFDSVCRTKEWILGTMDRLQEMLQSNSDGLTDVPQKQHEDDDDGDVQNKHLHQFDAENLA